MIPTEPATYSEAVDLYAKRISNRVCSVYQVGNVTFPGLSDIDLLVIIDRGKYDNDQFFSIFERLPRKYRYLFLHEAFVVPREMTEVLRHTSHSERTLKYGLDLIGDIEPNQSPEERWCKLLESYINYSVFCEKIRIQTTGSGRLMVAVANTMRFALKDFDRLTGDGTADRYASCIDSLRLQIVAAPTNISLLDEVWRTFQSAYNFLTANLEGLLPLGSSESLIDYSREFLAGRRMFAQLDVEAIRSRYREITEYYSRIRALRLSFGSLFYAAAYKDIYTRFQPHIVQRVLFRLYYRTLGSLGR